METVSPPRPVSYQLARVSTVDLADENAMCRTHADKVRDKAAKDKVRGREHEKKPAWLATTVAEYADGRDHSTGEEPDELESGSSDEDVQVSALTLDAAKLTCIWQRVESSKGKGKAAPHKGRGKGKKSRARDDKGDSRGRAMLRELPNEVRSLVTRASIFLRIRISLENAWTMEKKNGNTKLPDKHTIIKKSIADVWEVRDGNGDLHKPFDLGFEILNDEKNAALREDVFSLVRAPGSCLTSLTIIVSSGRVRRSSATRSRRRRRLLSKTRMVSRTCRRCAGYQPRSSS